MSKTPVSILQEFVVSRKIGGPDYQIRGTGHPHSMMFTCNVTVGEQTATGVGNTKKEAKHRAAEELLKLLGVLNNQPKISIAVTAVTNKAQMPLIMNYVGKLNEYCSINKKPLPIYAEHCTEHYTEFQGRFCVICTYQDHTTKGYGITKKDAKQDSARQMLEIIKENKDVLDQGQEKTTRKFETDPEMYDIVLKKFSELKGSFDMGEQYENNNEERSSDVKVDISTWDELTELLKTRKLKYEVSWIQHNPLILSLKIEKLVLILTGKSEEDIKEKFARKVHEMISNSIDFSKIMPDL